MRRLFPVLALLLCLFSCRQGSAAPLIQRNDRLAICGDPMTANLGYAVYIEDYLLGSQRIPGLEVSEFGWSSYDAAGFVARLGTDLFPYKPTVVMTCFGFFDGRDKALTPDIASNYRKAQTEMVEAFKKNGVRTILLGSPRCVDSYYFHRDPALAAVYNKTLAALADIDKDIAAKEGVVYADVFGATLAAMTRAKALYGEKYRFVAEREEEPGNRCSLVMAYAFLKALQLNGEIGRVTATFPAGPAEGSLGQKILSFQERALKIESVRYPFSFDDLPPWNEPQTPGTPTQPILACVPFSRDLNRYILVVKGLPTAHAQITWGDRWHDYSALELAKGVNLTADMTPPFGGPSQSMDGPVRDQQQTERVIGSAFVRTNVRDAAGMAQRDAFFQKALTHLTPFQHTLSIQPLAPEEKPAPYPVPVIVDTDMSSDCDDAGAVALLNTFMNQGQARLIACLVNGRNSDLSSGAVVQAINAYYGHPSIPIGANHGEAWAGASGSAYALKIHRQFDPDFPTDDRLPAGVEVYRRALASAADHSVVICSIGFIENLDALMRSTSDAISPLSGPELIRRKVRELVVMANTTKHDAFVLSHWPTKILWSIGIGTNIGTGKTLSTTPENNPVRVIYHLNGAVDGRNSWDLTAAWAAVRGPGPLWDVSSGGYWKVNEKDGWGAWVDGPATNQGQLLIKMPIPEVAARIETELTRPPQPDLTIYSGTRRQ